MACVPLRQGRWGLRQSVSCLSAAWIPASVHSGLRCFSWDIWGSEGCVGTWWPLCGPGRRLPSSRSWACTPQRPGAWGPVWRLGTACCALGRVRLAAESDWQPHVLPELPPRAAPSRVSALAPPSDRVPAHYSPVFQIPARQARFRKSAVPENLPAGGPWSSVYRVLAFCWPCTRAGGWTESSPSGSRRADGALAWCSFLVCVSLGSGAWAPSLCLPPQCTPWCRDGRDSGWPGRGVWLLP